MTFSIRKAAEQDVPVLRELIDASVRGLQSADYSPTQIESALAKAKEAVKGDDKAALTDATSELQKASHAMAEALYKKDAGNGQPGAGHQDNPTDAVKDGEVVDAEFAETK